MADGASSPLFMPQGTPEGNSSPPKRGDGSGSGNGNDSIKSEQGTPEVKDERSPSPPRAINAFPARGKPTASPRPFAPLTSRAERNRRKAANESATPDHAIANAAPETAGPDMQTAARNSAMHNTTATNALPGAAPSQPTTQAHAAPRVPQFAPPPPETVGTGDLLVNAHRHLNALAANLRKQEHDACNREEHLATQLEQAREIRAAAIQDRSNGLVIIRDRKRKLDDLEKRILNGETIDPDELIALLELVKLEQPVGREEFERMQVEGNGVENEDGYGTDPLGSG
ncbi:hypothetical protein Q7P35_005408 [Cladosporium inversicolor]